MIRQPEFTTNEIAETVLDLVKKKKNHRLLDHVKFEKIQDGLSVQMLHTGSYDDEPASFKKMDAFCLENNLSRTSKTHREIYLSDARKVNKEKLKTVLRYFVIQMG